MPVSEGRIEAAVEVARLYYYQGLTTSAIAEELNLSRSKVSRLLSFAKDRGLVEVVIHDPEERPQRLESELRARFDVRRVKVVSVPETADEREWLERVAMFAAGYLGGLMGSDRVLALAWGTTVSAVSRYLTPKKTFGSQVVQLNGSGNTLNMSNTYAAEIVMRFADNFEARANLFPVPTLFDYAETKAALWRERSIRRILNLQQRANLLLYSIGAVQAGVPSHVYSGDYLESQDRRALEREGVVGDIATVFFRQDGRYRDIPLNARASGPDLALFKRAEHAICVVSGRGKVPGTLAALKGGYLSDLILDEPTARTLLTYADGQVLKSE